MPDESLTVRRLLRRKEKQRNDRDFIDRVIHSAAVCRVAASVANQPFIVPLSFGYDGRVFYFHTATEGTKIDFWTATPRVCFEVEGRIALITGEKGRDWTMTYESVIGFGLMEELIDPIEKETALQQIMLHYSGRQDWPLAPAQIPAARLWKLKIHRMTGKESDGE